MGPFWGDREGESGADPPFHERHTTELPSEI